MWEDSSSPCHAWSEKEQLANLVVSDLGIIEDEDFSRSYDDHEGGVDNEDGGHGNVS